LTLDEIERERRRLGGQPGEAVAEVEGFSRRQDGVNDDEARRDFAGRPRRPRDDVPHQGAP
jgi:hypothetical protein